MKTVGKQLQEARLAKNWTPELAARETKIKVDRLHDLEKDDYSHFTSPAYARGFVRTYARSLGLDEYKILRQLDNKLPDDDHATLVTDAGGGYLPGTTMPSRAAHRDYAGLYIVVGLGCLVSLVIAFVLFEVYRVGELQRYFARASAPETFATDAPAATNDAPESAGTNTVARALPVDSNTPPPIADATPGPTPASTDDMTHSLKALPVDPAALAHSTNAAPGQDASFAAVKALPVNPSELTNAAPQTVVLANPVPPRALPVDPAELAAISATNAPEIMPAQNRPAPVTPFSARQSNSGPVVTPAPPVAVPVPPPTPAPAATTNAAPQTTTAPDAAGDKRLVLTASQDSFVQVTGLDASGADKSLYASVLPKGHSVGFDGHKFSINIGIPSAVDITLDGVNYGPHSDHEAPETFVVESHQP